MQLYALRMIQSFSCKQTERIFKGMRSARLAGNMQETGFRKLAQLDQAHRLNDLRVPPGNRLETLRDDRAGQYSIRVNQQWRVCFRWTKDGPADVEIADYH